MDATNYSNLALRTLNPGDEVNHALMGMIGECGEIADYLKKVKFYGLPLDREVLIKECGDFLWYYNLLCVTLHYNFTEMVMEAIDIADAELETNEIIYAVARAVGDLACGVNNDTHDDELVWLPIGYLADILLKHDLTFEEVFEKNIVKLEKRYPDLRFNAEHAINKDEIAEREAVQVVCGGGK